MKSKAWHQRHKSDAFVKQAQKQGLRARSAYKLEEIDQKDKLFKPNSIVLDVGAAPGSWSQYAKQKVNSQKGGLVIGVDRLEIEPIDGVTLIQGDILEQSTVEEIKNKCSNSKVSLVICDIAPDITGIKDVDQANMVELLQLVVEFSLPLMAKNASMLLKVFEGQQVNEVRDVLKEHFSEVFSRKPKASRDRSKEFYLLAKKYKGSNAS